MEYEKKPGFIKIGGQVSLKLGKTFFHELKSEQIGSIFQDNTQKDLDAIETIISDKLILIEKSLTQRMFGRIKSSFEFPVEGIDLELDLDSRKIDLIKKEITVNYILTVFFGVYDDGILINVSGIIGSELSSEFSL